MNVLDDRAGAEPIGEQLGVATASEQQTTIFIFLNKQDNMQGPNIFSGTLKVVHWT
jgi:hypothetical protein